MQSPAASDDRSLSGETLVSAQQCANLASITVGTWWAWAREVDDFPKPLKLSARCTRWLKSEVVDWLESRRVE